MRPFANFYRQVGFEISRSAPYFDEVIQVDQEFSDNERLFDGIQAEKKRRVPDVHSIPVPSDPEARNLIVLNANFNYSLDIEALLQDLRKKLTRGSRVVVLSYNPYYQSIFSFLTRLRLMDSRRIKTFITRDSLQSLAAISSYQCIRSRPVGWIPFRLGGVGDWVSRLFCAAPFFRWFSPAALLTLRPVMPSVRKPSLSIVIPARNEAGNIPDALRRLPDFEGAEVEVVFVEGNSTDDTWKVIQEAVACARGPVRVRCIQQPGKGKNDAVRAGFEVCRNDLLVILDADLTMPPEMLPRFYRAYSSGHADFINGSRLVYPMEGEAMRFLNRLGNVFFVKALNHCLENTISDSLCGTKLIARRDYERLKKWRSRFGDFDPFGDFELLYFASILPLGIVDVPIYYRARTYGETNIRRFRDGWILLKMTITAWFRIRL